MSNGLTYLYKDEDWTKEWKIEGAVSHTLMDVLKKNPDRENGCQCEVSLLTLEAYEYTFNLFAEDLPYDEVEDGSSQEPLSVQFKIQLNDVEYYEKTEMQLIQLGQLFEMKLRQSRNEIASILMPMFADPEGSGEKSSIDMSCECIDELFIGTFYIHIAALPNFNTSMTLEEVYEKFIQLHDIVNKANEVAKLF